MSTPPRIGPPPTPLSAWIAGRLLAVSGWNAVLAVAAVVAASPEVPGPLRMAGASMVVLVLPGAAWIGLFRRALDPPRLALAVVGLSSLVTAAGLLATAVGVGDPSRLRLLLVVAASGTAGLLAFGAPRRLAPGSPWGLLALVALAGFTLTSSAALWLVPPLAGHDMDVRGTAWGLAAHGRPWYQTRRETSLPLAHPVLFHAQVAESLLVTGEIGATERSSTSAQATAAARSAGLPVDTLQVWREDHAAFLAEPALTGTRAPSALLSAATLALLFELLRRLTGSRTAGLAGVVLFALAPEALVHTASAGYFAPATFSMLTAAMLTEPPPVGRKPELRWIAASAALCALLDHTTFVLIVGSLGVAALHALLAARREAIDRKAVALCLGFAAGTLVWWGYGIWVGGRGFVDEHLRMPAAIGSVPDLWAAFSEHTGHGLVPVALLALAVWAFAAGAVEPRRTLAGWGLAVAILSATASQDLTYGLAPLVCAAFVLAWTGFARRPRTGGEPLRAVPRPVAFMAAALLAASLIFDLAADVRLLRDFDTSGLGGW